MFTVEEVFEATVEVKRSKFTAYAIPASMFEAYRDALRTQHPKANHIVYALREIDEDGRIVEKSNDDGEPKGCAGMPVLNVLRGESMVACGLCVVRYFGGIKLGTGGMARAYAQAAKTVLATSRKTPYEKKASYRFETTYKEIDTTAYLLKQANIEEIVRDFGIDTVVWHITANESSIEAFKRLRSKCKR